jgi:hypothetical protein
MDRVTRIKMTIPSPCSLTAVCVDTHDSKTLRVGLPADATLDPLPGRSSLRPRHNRWQVRQPFLHTLVSPGYCGILRSLRETLRNRCHIEVPACPGSERPRADERSSPGRPLGRWHGEEGGGSSLAALALRRRFRSCADFHEATRDRTISGLCQKNRGRQYFSRRVGPGCPSASELPLLSCRGTAAGRMDREKRANHR